MNKTDKSTLERIEKMKNKVLSEQHKKKIGESNNSSYTIEQIQEKYPIFAKEEEMRYHPETGEIQVHCKNHNCPNSKEQNGWFTPTQDQRYHRMAALEYESGNGGEFSLENGDLIFKIEQAISLFIND